MADKRILDKIKKCLALASSSNEHEAKAAMQRAQALMKKHGVTSEHVALSDVQTALTRAGKAANPPRYHQMLIHVICHAFGVEAVHRSWSGEESLLEFIGIEDQAELSAYAYQVLFRQLTKARKDYMKTLKRYKRENKTRKADIFAESWVHAVYAKVSKFAQAEEHKQLIEQFKAERYGEDRLKPLKGREHKRQSNDDDAEYAGYLAGKQANLRHGVKGHETAKLNQF